jgi:hypothetical protein
METCLICGNPAKRTAYLCGTCAHHSYGEGFCFKCGEVVGDHTAKVCDNHSHNCVCCSRYVEYKYKAYICHLGFTATLHKLGSKVKMHWMNNSLWDGHLFDKDPCRSVLGL